MLYITYCQRCFFILILSQELKIQFWTNKQIKLKSQIFSQANLLTEEERLLPIDQVNKFVFNES